MTSTGALVPAAQGTLPRHPSAYPLSPQRQPERSFMVAKPGTDQREEPVLSDIVGVTIDAVEANIQTPALRLG